MPAHAMSRYGDVVFVARVNESTELSGGVEDAEIPAWPIAKEGPSGPSGHSRRVGIRNVRYLTEKLTFAEL